MLTHNYPYKNFVFEGGGVKGVAYGGVFEVLMWLIIASVVYSNYCRTEAHESF